MPERVGVAISTTGDEHRLHLLQQAALRWKTALPYDAHMYVTVDGTEQDAEQVRLALGPWRGEVYRVGQVDPGWGIGPVDGLTGDRLGVAANKNTGLELLMKAEVDHLFLSDDDTWPLYAASLEKHINFEYHHSMVCWGAHRLDYAQASYAAWKWPRGVMLYQTRAVVERVGGMDERFGLGGHEHAEYSLRINNTGLTAMPFVTPASYATRDAMGARALWHAEDMPREGEARHVFQQRKRALTTLLDGDRDWEQANKILKECDGSTAFVPYRAVDNGRASATLCTAPRA